MLLFGQPIFVIPAFLIVIPAKAGTH